jgi:transposase
VSQASRLRALEAEGLLHPRADAVTAAVFAQGGFFLAADKVQVKYEMLRAHLLDGVSVTAAAAAHGYSRAGFYLVAAAFEQAGMSGLLDDKRGRRGPVKLTAEIVEFLQSAPPARSGAELAVEVADRFGVVLHRRTVERAPAGGEYRCARLARSPVLAGRRGGAGRLRGAAGARAGHRRGAGQPGRRPVHPPRPARADRLAERRAGLRGRAAGRAAPAVDPA